MTFFVSYNIQNFRIKLTLPYEHSGKYNISDLHLTSNFLNKKYLFTLKGSGIKGKKKNNWSRNATSNIYDL